MFSGGSDGSELGVLAAAGMGVVMAVMKDMRWRRCGGRRGVDVEVLDLALRAYLQIPFQWNHRGVSLPFSKAFHRRGFSPLRRRLCC
jgi:hypothetical protein